MVREAIGNATSKPRKVAERENPELAAAILAELVNELIEAKRQSELKRVTHRGMRYELIVIGEMATWRGRKQPPNCCFR